MNKYISNQNDLLYYTDMELLSSLVLKWVKAKPDNKELKAISDAVCSITIYVNSLQMDRNSYNQLISEWRSERNNAILKCRAAEEKIEQLQEQLKTAKYEL